MGQYRELIALTDEQRKELKQRAQSRRLPAGDVFRARLILALADGWSYTQIKQRWHTSAPTISRWKQRFEQDGIAGLEPQHKGSQPRVADAQVQARIVRQTRQKPPDGSTHWSCRKMAEAMGVSKSTVQRVWAQARLKPHRLGRYMASDDPQLRKRRTLSGCISIRRNTQPCSAWTRRPQFKRWTGSIRCCRFLQDGSSGMDSNTTVMARCRCTRRWM